MSETIKKRSELIFLYDVKDINPNGDPADENKPRMDEETRINIVTDVRLKRTIRDYLHNFKGKEIFVRKISDESGNIQDAKARGKDFQNNPETIIKECIDVRLFGGTIPIATGKSKDSSIIYTGPVQFKMG
ncbi:MAG: type I CRISPR-associated protein Cas7, partial [Candidatus Methanofastidiosa archaeon]|nr:type I CRISPR-associated protein Cas7 [Candidatus Methanofastidiosa archaeon]